MALVRNTRRSPLLQAALLILASSGLFYGGFVYPLKEDLSEIQLGISGLKSKLGKRNLLRTQLAESTDLAEERHKQISKLLSIPTRKQFSVLQALQQLASTSNVGISWRKSGKEEETGNISFQLVTIQLKGKYRDLRTFLVGISQLDRIVGIGGFEIQTTTNDHTTLQAELILQIPFSEGAHNDQPTTP